MKKAFILLLVAVVVSSCTTYKVCPTYAKKNPVYPATQSL